jgi:muconolactone delta-isomerase
MRFLVETSFKQTPNPEVLALIPAEVEHGRALDTQGIREALYISSNQTKAWQIYRGDSVAAVQRIVETFPLHPYLLVTITLLADAVS